MEHMILGTVVAENELSDVHRSGAKARNEKTTTGIIEGTIIVYETPEMLDEWGKKSRRDQHVKVI